MVRAAEAHEDQLYLDSTDCVTTGLVESGRVRRLTAKESGELLFFTTATTIGLFLDLFSSALGSISGSTLTGAAVEVAGTTTLLRARTIGAAGAVCQRDTVGRARGDSATTAASEVSTEKQVILLLIAREGGEAVLLGKEACTTRENEHTGIPILTTYSDIVISETYA